MARPRAFDIDAALEAALRVFWERGYCGASIDELVRATGVARGSLYAAFGDKDGLFLAALERYETQLGEPMIAAATAPGLSGRKAVTALLTARVDALTDAATPAGCFGVNTLTDGAAPIRARERLAQSIDGQRKMLASLLEREVKDPADVENLAWFYVGVIQGLGTLARVGAEAFVLRSVADAAASVLDAELPRGRSKA